jgi:O-acetyl-ADP-ribose deacetylase (regulator of RNase III)
MRIQLAYRDEQLGNAWRDQFGHEADVEVVGCDITTLHCDAIVSPANSFGFMDGGLDLVLSSRFGWSLQDRVRGLIEDLPEKELLIGKALAVATDDEHIPWLIVAPTMRVPMSFNIGTSINAYLAMKAILITAKATTNIDSIAIPGLCTGVGRMPAVVAAKQMFMAYDEIIRGNHRQFEDFDEAQKHQLKLNPDGLIWDF